MDGHFTVSSGRMVGKYRERRYDYEILQVDLENGDRISESEKDRIDVNSLREADRVMFTVTGGHLKGEKAYRWVGGPFPSQRELEEAIEDMMLSGSP